MDQADRLAEELLLRTVTHRETLRHSLATRDIAYTLAARCGFHQRMASAIARAALLHDLGKGKLPDAILDAPRPLTSCECHDMRQHPRVGAEIARTAGIAPEICDWIAMHHERPDGSGYEGLHGDAIPTPVRVLIVADVWEATGALRPYSRFRTRDERWRILGELGFPHEVAVLRGLLEDLVASAS